MCGHPVPAGGAQLRALPAAGAFATSNAAHDGRARALLSLLQFLAVQTHGVLRSGMPIPEKRATRSCMALKFGSHTFPIELSLGAPHWL